jgi:hypothetical protein
MSPSAFVEWEDVTDRKTDTLVYPSRVASAMTGEGANITEYIRAELRGHSLECPRYLTWLFCPDNVMYYVSSKKRSKD